MTDRRLMRAITLWQPWAQIVARGHKLVENRSWHPPHWLLGERIAIHAGSKWDAERFTFINALYEKTHGLTITRDECEFGAILATAVIDRVVESTDAARAHSPAPHGAWFFGPVGWILSDVRQLCPAWECRGYQKLWTVPADARKSLALRGAV